MRFAREGGSLNLLESFHQLRAVVFQCADWSDTMHDAHVYERTVASGLLVVILVNLQAC